MEVVKCEPWHISILLNQPEYRGVKSYSREESMERTAALPHSYSVLHEGVVLLTGGVMPYWDNRGEAWAVFNQDCKKHFLTLHNIAKRFFEICPIKRIEAAVEIDFEPGHRWVKALGFQKEADILRSYTPDGKDCSLYARVK